jgi:hypothetical protein
MLYRRIVEGSSGGTAVQGSSSDIGTQWQRDPSELAIAAVSHVFMIYLSKKLMAKIERSRRFQLKNE